MGTENIHYMFLSLFFPSLLFIYFFCQIFSAIPFDVTLNNPLVLQDKIGRNPRLK